MFWTKDLDVILCREVLNLNPYTTKKGSTQRSAIWEKVAVTLNNCSHPVFIVHKRAVRDHIGILVNRRKKKLRAEEKGSGISPDEPTELDELLEQIIALEESSEAEQQEMDREKNQKMENDRKKAEDMRLKAMEKLSDTRKRQSGDNQEDNQSKRPRRSGGDAVSYLSQRADANYALKEEELRLKKDQQEQQSQLLNVLIQQQQQQSQQTLFMMQQQQQQAKALMGILERIMNK